MYSTTQIFPHESKIEKYFLSDQQFDKLIPLEYRHQSSKHFTPIEVAVKAARFLEDAGNQKHILDIGAGIGKFCAAAGHFTHSKITGIEQRPEMVKVGNQLLAFLGITNAELKAENITQTNFNKFSGIYFFNSFHENIDRSSIPIDSTIEFSLQLFRHYTNFLYKKLEEMPVNTRLATYHTNTEDIPESYMLLESFFAGNLKLWIKYT